MDKILDMLIMTQYKENIRPLKGAIKSYLKPSSSGMVLGTLAGCEGRGGTGGLDGVV